MILPKCIVTAILQDESTQYEGKGTSFEKQVKKRSPKYTVLSLMVACMYKESVQKRTDSFFVCRYLFFHFYMKVCYAKK